ncbi:MAG: DUF929 family protein [Acidimicrobiaceae bacterium]
MAKSPANKKTQSPAKGGRPAGLFTWIAVGVVLVIVIGLVVIKMTSGSPAANASTTFEAVDATTMSQLSSVPASVFNTVGVTSPVAPITAPSPLSGQPALVKTVNGKSLPLIQYVGAEYCPYCAAERWTTIVALSRFGTFSNLGLAQSGATDVYPNTKTFTFRQSTYTSPYVAFASVETFTSTPNPATNFYFPLQKMTAAQTALVKKYDTMKYIPTFTSTQENGSIPFIDMGNKFLSAGASFTPAALAGLSQGQIASALSDATNPVTQAIIASANEHTAAICVLTNNKPAAVCSSAGVKAAKKVMKIK